MTPRPTIKVFLGLLLLLARPLLAQFNSGSTGVDGPLNVTTSTNLQVPPDGIFHFTTIYIGENSGLTFTRNALNTPVYLLATGDVMIEARSGINLDGGNSSGIIAGRGAPGGFDGGFGPSQGFDAGDGQGPGGGDRLVNAHAVHAFPGGGNSNVYGNTLLSPLVGGSGGAAVYRFGGGGIGGGGGGGAILVASSTRVTIRGTISATGGSGIGAGNGSGGAIRVVGPVIDGDGLLQVGSGEYAGRTRLDSLDRYSYREITLTGKGTRGSQMVVFPPGNQHLDIVNAAGTPIPVGANTPVSITLPVGADPNQLIRVQASGFTNDVPVRVKVTPENALAGVFDGVILQSSGNPAFADIQVTLPVDTVCHVQAWTR